LTKWFVTVLMVLLFAGQVILAEGVSPEVGALLPATASLRDVGQLGEANSTSFIALVLVNSTIYSGVRGSLERYEKDLENFGFEDVIILNWSDPSPLRVRDVLRQFYYNCTLGGALLVGDIPVAEYEMFTEWDYERFPIDLYYMDLDGNWTDSDQDGILDQHVGKKIAPDIWIGRIKTSGLGGDEIGLINDYFEKNHKYRNGELSAPRRALLYVDDDWANYADMDSYSVGLLYDEVTAVTDKATTNASDYVNRLKQGYEWVHIRSHGTWNRHHFMVPVGDGGVIRSTEYKDMDPYALFYQLFVCSSTRFTEPDYLAGEIVFQTDYGLSAIGSTKLGGMLMFWTFYEALARGRTIGDAFKEWFAKWGEGQVALSGGYVGRKWFYGLTIIGDPTLRLRWLGEKEIAELQRREEEVVDDLPLVQDMRRQMDSSQANYSSLRSEYDSLQEFHSVLQASYSAVMVQLEDIKSLLYFFLFVTVVLLTANIYLVKSKPRSRSLSE